MAAGLVELVYHMVDEDRGDECTCVGISLVRDPPSNAEYRSSNSPFITLRAFSGEIYRDGRVVHANEQHKAHPGDTIRVVVDLDSGSLSFQVNDLAPVTIASDLQGKTVYPVAYFYLGGGQEKFPIVRFKAESSRGAGSSGGVVQVDAPLQFQPLGNSCLEQEGSTLRRKKPEGAATGDLAYAYGVGPGEVDGVHAFRFKGLSGVSIGFGIVTSDALIAGFRGSPDTISSALTVLVWNTGRVLVGCLPEEVRAISYDPVDVIKKDETFTIRLKLGEESSLELVRSSKVIHVIPELGKRVPKGAAFHPFIALLAANDTITVEHQITFREAPGEEEGPPLKEWTSEIATLLRGPSPRRPSRAILEPTATLSLKDLLQHLDDPTSFYAPAALLEEVVRRGPDLAEADVGAVASAVGAALRRVGDNAVARAVGIEALLSPSILSAAKTEIVGTGVVPLLLEEGSVPSLTLLETLLTSLSTAFASYVRGLGALPALAGILKPGVQDEASDKALACLLLLLAPEGVIDSGLVALLQEKESLRPLMSSLVARYIQGTVPHERPIILEIIELLLSSGNKLDPADITFDKASYGAPFLLEPTGLEGALPDLPENLPAEAKREVAEQQEVWRGYVSRDGIHARSWFEASFLAIKDGDLLMLRCLLAVNHYAALVGDRPAFFGKGPWVGVLPPSALPATLLSAHDELAKLGFSKPEIRTLLVNKAKEFRKAKKDLELRESDPAKRYITHKVADGSEASFDSFPEAVGQFGFLHNDIVFSSRYPSWGLAKVVGVRGMRLWLQFQTDEGVTSRNDDWQFAGLRLVKSMKDPTGGGSTQFRLPLERGTRVVRGPDVRLLTHIMVVIRWLMSSRLCAVGLGQPGHVPGERWHGGGDGRQRRVVPRAVGQPHVQQLPVPARAPGYRALQRPARQPAPGAVPQGGGQPVRQGEGGCSRRAACRRGGEPQEGERGPAA
jgi:hypothetical protein